MRSEGVSRGLGNYLISTISSIQLSHSVVSVSLWSHGLQHARLLCPSPTPGANSDSCPLSWWCHPSLPLSFLSPPGFNLPLPQHQGLFQWVSSSHQVVKVLEFQLQHQSFQWIFRLSRVFSLPTPQFKSISSSELRFLYSSTLTSIHDYWKNHSFD